MDQALTNSHDITWQEEKANQLRKPKAENCIHQELEATNTYLLSDREAGSHR